MKILLLIILIIQIFSLTDKYYKNCNEGAPVSGFLTYSECQKYAASEAYCCLLYYITNRDVSTTIIFKKKQNNTSIDKADEQKEIRHLSERENLCFGLSAEGYYNIGDVIDELKKETGVKEIKINCFSRTLNMSIILFIIFLNLF
jgi:hypothetical protein